jgi:hypothetical protein
MRIKSIGALLYLPLAGLGLASQAQAPVPPGTFTVPGETLVLRARGEGVQIYSCVQDGDWKWKLKAPEATLFDSAHHAIGKHFAGPKWRLDDGSELQGKLLSSKPQPGTIPWLILSATPTGGKGKLSQVTTVERSETQGGVAPASGCDAGHANAEVRVPYTATYSFFQEK